MKKLILKLLQFLFSFLGSGLKKRLILHFATVFRVNIFELTYNSVGILNYKSFEMSGEEFVLKSLLHKYISEAPVFFDVGANVGNYSTYLMSYFPNAKIYAFEPNPSTYEITKSTLSKLENVKTYNFGLSNDEAQTVIYTQKSYELSPLASLYNDNIKDDSLALDVHLTSLDLFCQSNKIKSIDFLKIDTEGHEYAVLEGGIDQIQRGQIKIIQFEFNEMHITSRVFLKDFFSLLENYNFYRLLPNGLYSLNPYKTQYEIFQFQNILCIRKDIDKGLLS